MSLHSKPICFFSIVAASLTALPLHAEEKVAKEFTEMVTEGKVNLDFRYRYEHVDQDNRDKHANANTLRSRLTLTSAAYKGFSLLGELDNVAYIGDDDFNSTENGETQYPVVADPKGTQMNQLWLRYKYHEMAGTFGRQRIIYDGARFIGNVGWRQNEQTYDGLRLGWQASGNLSLEVAYVYQVNRIFGPDDGPVQPADLEGDNYFVHGNWQINEDHALTAFVYILDIDYDKKYAPGKSVDNSTESYGVEYGGQFGPVSAKAAYARQSDADISDSNLNYDADYYMVEGGVTFLEDIKAHIGYEVLASDNDVGFKTPYATLHKFQGWADMFLVTPNNGIEDLYGGLSAKLGPVKLQAVYHDMQAESSGGDFGSEVDLVATWSIGKMWTLQLKYADFSTDNETLYPDTKKTWAVVNFKY